MAYTKRFRGTTKKTFAIILAIALSISFGTTNGASKNSAEQEKKEITGDFRESSQSSAYARLQARINNFQDRENYYAAQLEQFGIKLRPGSEHRRDSAPTTGTSRHCKSVVYQTLMNLPNNHVSQIANLTLFYTKDGRRGLGGSGSIILRCLNVTDAELASVLVHEVGHLVDSSLLIGMNNENSGFYDFDVPVSTDDASLIFYKISWLSDKKQNQDSVELDFVSLYAMTDPFEDFAETYAYYRLHGSEFRQLAETNYKLRQKYSFMETYVFEGEEFMTQSAASENVNIYRRNYDVTVLPYSFASVLNSID